MNLNSATRGTCRYCGQRVRVSVPRGGDGSARMCGRHKMTPRQLALQRPEASEVCPGVRTICEEDHRP